MQFNLQMDGADNGGSEQPCSSDYGQFNVAVRKMVKKEIEVMMISSFHQLVPRMEDLMRKIVLVSSYWAALQNYHCPTSSVSSFDLERGRFRLHEQEHFPSQYLTAIYWRQFNFQKVKEEIQPHLEKLSTGCIRNYDNGTNISRERNLQLKLDEVSGPVLTGKAIKSKEDTPIRVALVDETTGHVVNSGPESCAKVEIVLDASGDDNEHNSTPKDLNNRIIEEGDKKKPYFSQSYYIHLKEGVGFLHDVKLGQGSSWTKKCNCKLGARIVENLRGVQVQEAWTKSFEVSDSRSKWNKKNYPPLLEDPVWRLENIGRRGDPCKRLEENNILQVKHFLHLHSTDPGRLQKIVGASAKKWKATVDHAKTCIIDDHKIYLYYPSEIGVTFDVVGGLKGIICDSYYVPINKLSVDDKDFAHNLLLSAFENQKDITSFPEETSLLHQYPYRPTDINAATNSSLQKGSPCHDAESIIGHHLTEPGSSTQIISPCISTSHSPNNISHFGSLGSAEMGQQFGPYFDFSNQIQGCQFSDRFVSPFSPESNNFFEALWTCGDPQSHQQENASKILLSGPATVMLWMVRARKRFMALRGIHVPKRRRI